VLPLHHTFPDIELISIRLGYFFHLITDNLWYAQVGRPAWERWRADFQTESAFWNEIKSDWYGLDHAYVRAHPEALFWTTFVHCHYERDDLPFLPPQAIRRQLAYIQDWYRSEDDEIRAMLVRPFVYLSPVQADAFVDIACEQLMRVFRKVWQTGADGDGRVSALELV
jgi:hypothetical protein